MKDMPNSDGDYFHPTVPQMHYSSIKKHTSIRVDPYLWGLFQERCENLGLSSCFVVESLIRAWVTGERVDIPEPNPVTVNMTVNYQVERPRRRAPQEIEGGLAQADLRKMLGACYRLDVRADLPGYVGFCSGLRKWLRANECQGCRHQAEF